MSNTQWYLGLRGEKHAAPNLAKMLKAPTAVSAVPGGTTMVGSGVNKLENINAPRHKAKDPTLGAARGGAAALGQLLNKGAADKMPGGLADDGPPKDLDPEQYAMGLKVEREHTSDPTLASEIALDHLTEDPEYYTKLKKMEGGGEKSAFDITSDNAAMMGGGAALGAGGLAARHGATAAQRAATAASHRARTLHVDRAVHRHMLPYLEEDIARYTHDIYDLGHNDQHMLDFYQEIRDATRAEASLSERQIHQLGPAIERASKRQNLMKRLAQGGRVGAAVGALGGAGLAGYGLYDAITQD